MSCKTLGCPLHLEHHAIDLGFEKTPCHEARNSDQQAQCRVVQRHRNAVGQFNGLLLSRRLQTKQFNHANDGSQQAKQGCRRRQCGQSVQVTLKSLRRHSAFHFHAFSHVLVTGGGIERQCLKARCKNGSNGTHLGQFLKACIGGEALSCAVDGFG